MYFTKAENEMYIVSKELSSSLLSAIHLHATLLHFIQYTVGSDSGLGIGKLKAFHFHKSLEIYFLSHFVNS
jgi:hypothetical protein